ncbi:MAG: hypothetical protein NXI04_16245 [Planctomycetaceae bacterium]|nr:hypothetical protein [Planctomycetaceae bacterium]
MSLFPLLVAAIVTIAGQVTEAPRCCPDEGPQRPPDTQSRDQQNDGPSERPAQPLDRRELPSATYIDGNTEPYTDTKLRSRTDRKPAKDRADIKVPPPPAEPVPLLDGAPTARAALDAMVAASSAGDEEAALMLVDPAIRPLMMPDIAIERVAIDSILLEHACFGEPEFSLGGILFWFTLRDLVRIRSLEVQETRVVDENRVVFTVKTVEKSYHSDEHHQVPRQILTVRREGKWYVFRPYGLLVTLLRGEVLQLPDNSPPPIVVYHESKEQDKADVKGRIEYLIPIEIVHEHLAKAATAPKFREFEVKARRIERQFRSVVARAKRGDFKTREELKAALNSFEDSYDQFAEVNPILTPGIRKLAEQHLSPASK